MAVMSGPRLRRRTAQLPEGMEESVDMVEDTYVEGKGRC